MDLQMPFASLSCDMTLVLVLDVASRIHEAAKRTHTLTLMPPCFFSGMLFFMSYIIGCTISKKFTFVFYKIYKSYLANVGSAFDLIFGWQEIWPLNSPLASILLSFFHC